MPSFRLLFQMVSGFFRALLRHATEGERRRIRWEVVLAIKKNRAATCWTGRYFLDPGCIEVALTRGTKGTYVFMDEVLELDATTTHKSALKKQMISCIVRQHL